MAQTKVGWRPYVATTTTTASTLLTSIYGVWNADALGTSLDTSIYGVYNGDNVNDTSGNARNGTNVNNVTFTTGKVGNAFTFNGSNYVSLPNNSNQFNFTTDFSFSFWVYIPSVATATNGIFANYTNVAGSRGFIAYLKDDGKFEFLVFGAYGTSTATSTAQIPTGWTHIAVSRKMITSKETQIYINGVLNAQSGVNNAVTLDFYSTSNPSIGAINSLGTGLVPNLFGQMMNNSKIDGLTVWNKVLTANEITSLYNAGTGAEYPFSSQTLPSPNDAVSANHGTLMNGTTFTDGKIGKAFTFDGINDHITLADNSLNLTGPFSYSFWIKSSDTTNYGVVVGNMQSARTPYGFFHGYEISFDLGKYFFYFRSGTNIQHIHYTTNVVNNGNWNHIVVTYDPNNLTTGAKIYVNGTVNIQANTLGTSNPIGYSSPMKACIGARNHSGSPVNFLPNGTSLDALSTWNKELTQSEITELYNSGTGKQYPNY